MTGPPLRTQSAAAADLRPARVPALSPNGRNRRTAAARGQAETLLERPVFGIKRPFSNAWGIRGPRGWHISIQHRRRDAEAVRDLSHADVGIGEHRLGRLDVVVGKFWWTASGAARAPGGGKAGLGALSDQTALEFRQRAEHVKKTSRPCAVVEHQKLPGENPAIDCHSMTHHEVCRRTAKPNHNSGDLLGLTEASDRFLGHHPPNDFWVVIPRHEDSHRRLNHSRGDGVDANAPGGIVERSTPRPTDHRLLAE